MTQDRGTALKVGGFALLALVIILYATARVSQDGLFSGGTYTVYAVLDSAEGLEPKTPIEIAGIQVGTLGDSELVENRRARAAMKIRNGVKLSKDVVAQVRTKGFLGESYIDLRQGDLEKGTLTEGQTINATNPFSDLSQLSGKLNEIADDVHEMTSSVKTLFQDNGEQAPIKEMILNMRDFTKDLKHFGHNNRDDMDRIVANLAVLTDQLRVMVQDNRQNVDGTFEHIQNIAQKIDEGRGTLGRLINDETTIDGLNKAVDGLNEALGGISSFQLDMGYHLEYLGRTGDFKNYVELGMRTRPDRAFLVEFVSDPNPSADREIIVSDVTTGGTTTSVTTERAITKRDQFRLSAQLAQDFHDFTIRGGMIESRAGIGIDWRKKFFKASFSAFDFQTDNGQKPHLKAWGTLNLTKNLYVLGGIDDPLNPNIKTDWFVGAGFRFVDNDIKSLLGLGAAAAK